MRKLFYIGGSLFVILVAGYFICGALIRQKIGAAIRALPPSMQVTYGSLHPDILGSTLVIDDLQLHSGVRQLFIEKLTVKGISYWSLASSRRNVNFSGLQLKGLRATAEHKFSFTGDLELDSVYIADLDKPSDSIRFGAIRLRGEKLSCQFPDAYESLSIIHLELDSKRSSLTADTIRIIPTVDKMELGGIKGRQTDVLTATAEGLSVEDLHVMDLLQRRLIAGTISVKHSQVYAFRDRRLPLEPGRKPLPMTSFRGLPVSIRVQTVKFGTSTFTYEEFPGKGTKTGKLKIMDLSGTLKPLINHPVAGDPAYLTMTTQGSLMGSGSVTATTKMPLHTGDPYLVEGAFHNLDVTTLNGAAENLGGVHLESGMLNELSFRFDMNEEQATGRIVGEYHDLVVDKLRGGDGKKVDKVKSFFLKKLIIPKNKDHSLAQAKRTGKVNYRHDPERYFSYYLLHALLVGVKSSFSLGFLLPG